MIDIGSRFKILSSFKVCYLQRYLWVKDFLKAVWYALRLERM